MKLIINSYKDYLTSKTIITDDEKNEIFWSQPDFSYKHRVHVYDKNNNEIGYVQYAILSSQQTNELYYANDTQMDLSVYDVKELKDSCTVYRDNNKVMDILCNDNEIVITIDNEDIINDCLLIAFGIIK